MLLYKSIRELISHHFEADEEDSDEKEDSDAIHSTDYIPPIFTDIDIGLGTGVFIKAGIPTVDSFSSLSKLATVNLDVVVNGDVKLQMENSEPSLNGKIKTTRGSFNVLSVDFDVEEGDVSFVGKEYWNPEMDISARRSFGEYGDIVARVSGNTSNMSLDFSSDSENKNYDQTDIFSLMLVGKPTSITESQGMAL